MPAGGDSRTVYDARHWPERKTWLGARRKRWAHWGSRGTVLRLNNAPWIDMAFLLYTKEYGHIVYVAEMAAQYVYVSSRNLPSANLDFVAFDKAFDRLHV